MQSGFIGANFDFFSQQFRNNHDSIANGDFEITPDIDHLSYSSLWFGNTDKTPDSISDIGKIPGGSDDSHAAP